MQTSVRQDLEIVSFFLARNDVFALEATSCNVLVLVGSSLLITAERAAEAMREGVAPFLLISGGIGHSTQDLRDQVVAHPIYRQIVTSERSEAEIFGDIIVGALGVSSQQVVIENQSTNCGANACLSRKMVDQKNWNVKSMILIQDPTMQRRTHAAFERMWEDLPETKIQSHSVFVPTGDEDSIVGPNKFSGLWSVRHLVELLLGEIPRLRDDEFGYGPQGKNFIPHVDIPAKVLAAHRRLVEAFPDQVRSVN